MPGLQLPWNEELETLLLHCVIVKGSHICGGKKVTQSWSEVNDMFYEQDLLADYREQHYAKGNVRKIRDKYKAVLATVQNDIDSGNQSGKEGELSKLYEHVRTINDEISEKEARQEAGTELKEKLNDTEKTVLMQSGPLKRKLLNGEVIDNTKTDRPPPLSFNQQLMMFATGDMKSAMKKKVAQEEESFEIAFLEWLTDSEKTVALLCLQVGVNVSHLADIEDIGLKVLVSMYCTTGAHFAARVFKQELREMELPMVVCSKLYAGLQEWRREFESTQKLGITAVTTSDDDNSAITSSSSSQSVSSLGMFSPARGE